MKKRVLRGQYTAPGSVNREVSRILASFVKWRRGGGGLPGAGTAEAFSLGRPDRFQSFPCGASPQPLELMSVPLTCPTWTPSSQGRRRPATPHSCTTSSLRFWLPLFFSQQAPPPTWRLCEAPRAAFQTYLTNQGGWPLSASWDALGLDPSLGGRVQSGAVVSPPPSLGTGQVPSSLSASAFSAVKWSKQYLL